MEDDLISPLIARGFKRITDRFVYKNILVFLIVLAIYLASLYSLPNRYLGYLNVAFFLNMLYFFGVGDFFGYVFRKNIGQSFQNKPHLLKKRFLFSWLLWMAAMIAVSKIGWFAQNFDPGSTLFFAYLPAVWLFGIKREVNALLALTFLSLVPFFLVGKFEATAERLAIITYFLLVTSTIQGIIELKKEGGGNEK